MKVLLIIPAYNEEDNILKTCRDIQAYNRKHKQKYDFVVINDGSKDQTGTILDENHLNHVDLIHNLGIGGAVQTGYKYALDHDYDIAVQFDGDGQHDVSYVSAIIDPIISSKADFTIGSRFVGDLSEFQTTFARRVGIKIISFLIRFTTGKKVYDTTSGFRACNRDVIKEFASYYPQEYPEPITTVSMLKKRYRFEEIPVSMNERIGGASSISSWKKAYYMFNVCLSILIVGLRRNKK